MKVSAIIVAAGQGSRIGGELPKQFQHLNDKPLLYYTINKFEKCNLVDEIVLIVSEKWLDYTRTNFLTEFSFAKVSKVISGGRERRDSVYNGLLALKNTDIVLVHDAVRPFVRVNSIEQTILACREFGAVILAIPSRDTIKTEENGFVKETVDRKLYWLVQTPQTFKYELLLDAYRQAYKKSLYGTDESALVEAAGYPVKIVEGDFENIKITFPTDFKLAKILLEEGK